MKIHIDRENAEIIKDVLSKMQFKDLNFGDKGKRTMETKLEVDLSTYCALGTLKSAIAEALKKGEKKGVGE